MAEVPLQQLHAVWREQHGILFKAKTHDAIRLRMHRAFSWMKKADEFAIPEDADARLIFSWVAMTFAMDPGWHCVRGQNFKSWS